MSKCEKILMLSNKAILDIDDEINKHIKGLGEDGTISQLEQIKIEIEKMKEMMNPTEFKPYYPRAIVDSWGYNSLLGKKLLHLAEQYQKLK